ncbi:hypothetical protein CSB11_03080 [Candidatus Campbellbacteria bacterium]|nr:MAG: hypothetical protein CSB11_03080 [Candidatus Campbellbacteria bacterium]
MKRNSFYFSILFFVFGIVAGQFFSNYIFEFVFLTFLLFSTLFIFQIKNRKSKNTLLLFFLILFFFLGFLRNFTFLETNKGDLSQFLNKKENFVLIVDDIPEEKKHKTKNIGKVLNSDSKVIFWTSKYANLEYGDKIEAIGILQEIQNFKSQNSKEFDYQNFLKKDGIFYELKILEFKLLEKEQGNFIKQKLFALRADILERLKNLIPEEKGFLMSGLLIGAKENMSKEVLENFRKTGIIHIVVLSGFNLTLVAEFFMKIFAVLGLGLSSLFGSISILAFVIITGATATVVRASLMALIVIFANYTGRKSDALKALFTAGFLMLLYNPSLLLFDPSFQLSFLATFGLLLLSEKISQKIKFIPNNFLAFREILSATISTQIFVFPFLMYQMGEISIISPLVNILVLIIVPITMFLGFLVILFSFLSNFLALLLAFISYYLLFYILFTAEFFAQIPFAVYKNQDFSFLMMLSVYLFYLILYLIWKK